MYLARRHTDASLREVAQRLRVRDISTVSHGEKRITMSLQENSPTAKEVKRILNQAHSFKPETLSRIPRQGIASQGRSAGYPGTNVFVNRERVLNSTT
jgi:hypothetical protein